MAADLRSRAGRLIRSSSGLVLLAFPALAGFVLVTEHTARARRGPGRPRSNRERGERARLTD